MTTGVNLKRQDAIATLEIDGRTHLNLLGPDVFRALTECVVECAAGRVPARHHPAGVG